MFLTLIVISPVVRIICSGLVVLSFLSKNFLESIASSCLFERSNGREFIDWVMPGLNFAMTSHVVIIQACSHDLWSRG